MDASHKGPCAIYMKYMAFLTTAGGHGPGVSMPYNIVSCEYSDVSQWFKIWDEGYDEVTKQWCTEKIMQNNGLLSIRVPKDLLAGEYLVRTELLSLHEADKKPAQPQWYISCAQIALNSTGTASPVNTVTIPGYVKSNEPSLTYNIYNTPRLPYQVPGPARYESGKSKADFIKQDSSKLLKIGQLPSNAVLTNGNWWTKDVPTYTDEEGCRRVGTGTSLSVSLANTFS